MSFYTSRGDDGTTNLLGEGRVAKYHARIEAVGTLDESTAALGLARAQVLDPHSGPILLEAQRDLYKLMAEVAATPENAEKFHFIDAARVTWLEEQTDAISQLVERRAMPTTNPKMVATTMPSPATSRVLRSPTRNARP